MKKLLEKLKLVQYFNSELTMSKDEFLAMMSEKIDQEKPGFFSDSLDAWTRHKNKFKGVFSRDMIVFKRRQTFFNNVSSIPQATVTFQENYKKTNVTTKLNGLRGPFLVISILLLVAIPFNLYVLIRITSHPEPLPVPFFPLFFIPTVMLLFVYMFARIGITGLRKKISHELYKLES